MNRCKKKDHKTPINQLIRVKDLENLAKKLQLPKGHTPRFIDGVFHHDGSPRYGKTNDGCTFVVLPELYAINGESKRKVQVVLVQAKPFCVHEILDVGPTTIFPLGPIRKNVWKEFLGTFSFGNYHLPSGERLSTI